MRKPKKLKIAFVVDDTLDKTDGVQQYVLQLGKWFTETGHDVHYLVGQTNRSDIANIHSLAKNIPVTFNKNKLTIPLPANKKKLTKLLQTEQFDVLHVQMPYSPLFAARVVQAAPKETAIVGTFHILPFSGAEKFATKALGKLLKKSLTKFNAVLAVSEPAKEFAKYAFNTDAQVLPNVVDLAWFKRHANAPIDNSDPVTIVFLGRLVERKGSLQLLKAINALPSHIKTNIKVKLGGKGELHETLKAYVSAHDLSEIVELVGFVSEEDKPTFLRQADIAVFPSTGGESFGIVLIEAMAAGSRVVLGGNNPGYSSVLSEWPQTLFDPNNQEQFTAALLLFIENNQLRQTIYHQQQEAVDFYDVEVVGPKVLTTYQKVIANQIKKQDNIII